MTAMLVSAEFANRRINNRSDPWLKFWARVEKNGPIHPVHGQCWQWLGGVDSDGYGDMMVKRKRLKAHRYSYGINVGIIQEGLDVLHKCDNPACVNPSHLFLGTKIDNVGDMVGKGRQAKGEAVARHKLTTEQVIEIRSRYQVNSRTDGTVALAREYNVSIGAIWFIIKRRNWKHI